MIVEMDPRSPEERRRLIGKLIHEQEVLVVFPRHLFPITSYVRKEELMKMTDQQKVDAARPGETVLVDNPEKVSTNPKDKLGRAKPPLHLIPSSALIHEAVVMGLGANKYGPYNWRDKTVAATVYIAAAQRHLLQYLDGENTDPESGASHLAHARACLGIILDATENNNLVDDRPIKGKASELLNRFTQQPYTGLHETISPFRPETPPAVTSEEFMKKMNEVEKAISVPWKPCTHNWFAKVAQANLIDNLGCLPSVAREIVNGLRSPHPATEINGIAYVAGPMRGYENFNFPAFDVARSRLVNAAYHVISPADIDRAAGVKEDPEGKQEGRTLDFVYRDLMTLMLIAEYAGTDPIIVMLDGWEKSTGAVAEFFVARWLGIRVCHIRHDEVRLLRTFNAPALVASVNNFLNDQEQK